MTGHDSESPTEIAGYHSRADSLHLNLDENTVINERYFLIRKLGQGGMGEVWLAEDANLARRKVAIKFLAYFDSPAARQESMVRFEHEGGIMSRLKSPYIVNVTDRGRMRNGEPFIVMDYLQGMSLQEKMRQKRPSHMELIFTMRGVAQALVDAHAFHVVHRDLKPGNIFLEETLSGTRVKVLDFGIAKLLIDDGHSHTLPRTSTGMIVGTPAYMAPEQFDGKADPACDLYALGAVAYECLTGRLPFDGNHYAVFEAHYKGQNPEPVPQTAPGPQALKDLVLALLDKDPMERPSAADVIEELEAILYSGLASATSSQVQPQVRFATKLNKRQQSTAKAVIVIATLALIGLASLASYFILTQFGPL